MRRNVRQMSIESRRPAGNGGPFECVAWTRRWRQRGFDRARLRLEMVVHGTGEARMIEDLVRNWRPRIGAGVRSGEKFSATKNRRVLLWRACPGPAAEEKNCHQVADARRMFGRILIRNGELLQDRVARLSMRGKFRNRFQSVHRGSAP